MIKFKINGSDIQVASNWDDLTFGQYLQILKTDNTFTDVLAIITGFDSATLSNSKILGLESLIEVSSFLNHPPKFETYYPQIGTYKLEGKGKDKQFDVRYESLAQFEDARAAMSKVDSKDVVAFTKAYGRYVAIYLQKIRDGEYKNSKVEEIEAEVQNFRACEVIAMGQFFFLKLLRLLNGTAKTSPLMNRKSRRSKSASTSSKRSSGRTR